MFLITSPSFILFIRGSRNDSQQRNYVLTTSPSDLLFMTTLGNIGTTQTLCFTVPPGDEVKLKCQGKIVAISAYYGQPTGSCTCPVPQQPTTGGICPGKITQSGCSKDLYGKSKACYLSNYDLGYGTPQPCCAYTKVNGEPSLSELEIGPDYSCNSLTAQYIAEGMCLGRSSCILKSSDTHLYSWKGEYAKDLPSNVCKTSIKSKNDINRNQCNTTLTYTGSWAGCSKSSNFIGNKFMQIQAICSSDDVDAAGSSISKSNAVILASVLNAVAILVFTFGVYWVTVQQKKEEKHMDRNTCRAKDFTVCIRNIPPVYSSTQELAKKLKRHFEKVLSTCKPCFLPGTVKVSDINFTTGSYKVLQPAIKRGEAARELDGILYKQNVLEYLGTNDSWRYSFLEWRKKQWENNYQYWNDECLRSSLEASKQVKRAYVTFESEEGYKRCLKYFSSNGLGTFFENNDYLLEGKQLQTIPAEDPSDIIWENIGTPKYERLLRRTFTNLLLIALIVLTYLAVDAAVTKSTETDQSYPTSINCYDYRVDLNKSIVDTGVASLITYERVLKDVQWEYYNNTQGRQGYLDCYCREIFQKDGLSRMLNYNFYNEQDNTQEHWCKKLTFSIINVTLLRILVSIVVVGVNVSAKSILRALKNFEKRSSHSSISISMTYKLFFVQFTNAGLLIILMNGYIRDFNSDSSISFLNGKYNNFTIDWYDNVGKSLIGTMILYMFGIHSLNILLYLYQLFKRWQDKHFTNDVRLTYQVSQEQLNKLYIGLEFNIEIKYASMLTICYICVMYGSTMPIMYLIGSVSLLIFYLFDKYYFLRVNRIPHAVSPTLALYVTRTLYFASFLNLCIAIWSFSTVDVFDPVIVTKTHYHQYLNLNFMNNVLKFMKYDKLSDRVFNQYTIASWLGMAPLIISLFVSLFHIFIKRFGTNMQFVNKYFNHLIKNEETYEGHPEYIDSIPLYLLKRRVEDNIVKKHILERYKKRIKELENGHAVNGKQLEGLESYDIALNEIYADKFALNSDYILKHRPPDLFQINFCPIDPKDEENGLLGNNDENGPNVSQDYLDNLNNPLKSVMGRPKTSFAIPQNQNGIVRQQQQQQQSDQSQRVRNSVPSTPEPLPTTQSSTSKSKNRKSLEHIPSMCSIVNDEDVAEIKDVAELFK